MSIYRMSEVGSCSRALAASKLGNEPTANTSDDEIRLKYYTMLEEVCASKIADLHIGELIPGIQSRQCEICKDVVRSGIHVQLSTDLIDFVGHLDRRIKLRNGITYPVEIKCLGRFTWQKWVQKTFAVYPEYAYQEVCYLEAEGKPGLYFCMNRDTGDLAKYIINDSKHEINLSDFTNLTLPITFEDVVEKVNDIEIAVCEDRMPDGKESESCRWCRFRYLCIKDTEIQAMKIASIVELPELIDAARTYKEGHTYEKLGKEMKDTATLALLEHSKHNSINKYRVSNISISYRGTTTRKWYDAKVLEELVDKKVLNKAQRESEPYDSYSIRILREGDQTE